MKTYIRLAVSMAGLLWLAGCEEAKRYEISGGDSTPPGMPVFIDSEPLPGGARVYFRSPADEDLLSVEASYVNASGKRMRFAASYFARSVDVLGFGSEGDHTIELYAVDRSGNRSKSITETVFALEPPLISIAKTVKVLPSFASILAVWRNDPQESVYVEVDFSYTRNGVRHDNTRIFATFQSEMRSIDAIDLHNGEPVSVKVSVRDKYDNTVTATNSTIVLLTDEEIEKSGWTLPGNDVPIGGITQSPGSNMDMVIDGIIEMDIQYNYFITTEANPWNIIIDLGREYELSRIVTHQRWSGYETLGTAQGNLYRGQNVLTYNLYGWNDGVHTWEWLLRYDIKPPVVNDTEYTIMGKEGDMSFLYPDEPKFSKPTRYLRFEAVSGKYISEITLYGRTAQ